jgi:hypothetical protein
MNEYVHKMRVTNADQALAAQAVWAVFSGAPGEDDPV